MEEENRKWEGTSSLCKELKIRQMSHTQESTFTVGTSAGEEWDLWRTGGEHSNQYVEGKTK